MAEFYIREADAEEARGPYTPERIADLIEAGRANADTLYYDDEREDWFALRENPELQSALAPARKPLLLRRENPAEPPKMPPTAKPERPPVSVDEMLAAAEGATDETRHLKAREKRQRKAASLSLPALGLMLLLFVIIDIVPHWDIVQTLIADKSWPLLLEYPMLILGVVDLFFLLCCLLKATDIFPLIRVRAMIGLGFFTYVYWAWGDLPQSLAIAVGSLSIYVCTATLNLMAVTVFSVLGIASLGFLAVTSFL